MKTLIQPDLKITQAHWDWVNRLIADLKRDELREDIASALDKLVQHYHLFLEVEHMMESLPEGIRGGVMAAHKNSLEELQDIASKWKSIIAGIDPQDTVLNRRIAALTSNLDIHWRSWYAPVAPAALEELNRKLFDVAS